MQSQSRSSPLLKIGDQVLVHKTWTITRFDQKLAPQWIELYYIHDVLGNGSYKLRTMDGKVFKNVAHGSRLKLFHKRSTWVPVVYITPNVNIDGSPE